MKRIAAAALFFVLLPGLATAEIREIRQSIFGMD